MGIKGKTTFELTDVNTGEVEIIEDNNMITNALQEYLATYGMFYSDVFSSIVNNPLWNSLLSGLFLFDSTLDEDVNNTFMPAGVRMIGCGSKDFANSGAVTELGSYNASESGVQGDGSIKFVYDFSTQQANGTISCACLTSGVGGYASMGCESDRYYSDKKFSYYFNPNSYGCYSGIDGAGTDMKHILYANYSENAIYVTNPYNIKHTTEYALQHWSVTKKIQILKLRAGFTSVGIEDYQYLKKVIETYDVDIPQDILDYMGTSVNYAITSSDGFDGNIYVIFTKTDSTDLSVGSFFWIMKIDKNMQATAYKFTNNIGKSMNVFYARPSSNTGEYFDYYTFNGDYLWVYDNSKYIYGVNYTDSTQIIETGVKGNYDMSMYNVAPNLIGIYGKNYSSSNYYAPEMYDVMNRTHTKMNGKEELVSVSYKRSLVPFADKKGVYLTCYNGKISIFKDDRYLATINNLESPVVKTSSKTMKVTYTLTLEE